jgi:hypothetical protein
MPITSEDFDSMYGSNYLKASDLKGRRPKVTIADVSTETFRDGTRKAVISFVGKDKGMVLNATNARRLGDAYGTWPQAWIGKMVELYSEPVSFQGKTTEGLRLLPAQSAMPPATPAQPAPAPAQPTRDEMGDEVPF